MAQKSELASDCIPIPPLYNGSKFYPASPIREVLLSPEVREREERLSEVIASEILPRLMLVHHDVRPVEALAAPEHREIVEFGALVMSADRSEALSYFDQMRAKGHSLDTLFVHFLAPTARHLGELWEQDLCDFIDVSLGVARLQELLWIFGAPNEAPVADMRQRAFLVTTPAESHCLGLDIVASVMRAASWDLRIEKNLTAAQCAAVVAEEWFGVVGVALSVESELETVARTVKAIRRSSCNESIAVIVGGPVFTVNPDLAVQVGADATAADAPTAAILAKKLLLGQLTDISCSKQYGVRG
jgi:methanogenic corrinoid protein MtbC1